MFIYEQSTGKFSQGETLIGFGYSGAPQDKNVPEDQSIEGEGPIPVGRYTIGEPYTDPEKGPLVFKLTPDPSNNMFGRSGFLIHGDSILHPGAASHGCIILGKIIRLFIANSVDRVLIVV